MTKYDFYNPSVTFDFLLAAGCASYPDRIFIFNSIAHTHDPDSTAKALTHETIHLVLARTVNKETSAKFDNVASKVII